MGWQDDEVTSQAFSTYIVTAEIQHPEAISHTYDFLISADGQSCMWMLHVEQTGHSQSILNTKYQHSFEESSKAIQLAPAHSEFEIQQLNMDPWMRHEVETSGCIKTHIWNMF